MDRFYVTVADEDGVVTLPPDFANCKMWMTQLDDETIKLEKIVEPESTGTATPSAQ